MSCCHPGPLVLYRHFGEDLGGSKALAQQRAKLLGKAGGWCQSCWDMPHLPVVQERHGGAVALVPVVGVAGLRLLTGVALLGLVDRPTQINFCGLTIFAEVTEAVDKSGPERGQGVRDVLSSLQGDYDADVSFQDFFIRIFFGGDKL